MNTETTNTERSTHIMHTEKQIEFDKIKKIWMDLAITDYAKECIQNTEICLDEVELRNRLRDTTNSKEMIEKLGTPPLQNITEIRDIMAIGQKGDCLTPYQLERVERVLVVVERLRDYLSRGKQFYNSLAYYDENLDALSELREEINMKIRNDGVDDRATDR